MVFFVFLVFITLGTASPFQAVDLIEEDCADCVSKGWGYRYFKCLYPLSPLEYVCINASKHLPYGSIVVEVVRKSEDCQDIDIRMPSKNMTEIDDFSASYNMIDDIFIILGRGNSTRKPGNDQNHERWCYIPCMVCLILLLAFNVFKLRRIPYMQKLCFKHRQNRYDVEDIPIP